MASTDVAPATEKTAISRTAPTGVTNKSAKPADVPSAKRVITEAARSSTGILGLTTQSNPAAVTGALALLTGSSDAIGKEVAEAFAAIGNAAFNSITAASTWSALATAIAAS
jgi:hypothetical protein